MNKKQFVILVTWGVLLTEIGLLVIYQQMVIDFLLYYVWALPLLFFKSFIKQFLLLNVFGLFHVLWGLIVHIVKLLFLKLLKIFGVRYGAHFSSRQWQKTTQRFRILYKYFIVKQSQFRRFMMIFNKCEYRVIIITFFPIFLLLFLFGFAFRITREAMVKKGSEFGVAKVALTTARKNQGLIAQLRRLDTWILAKIEHLTCKKS